MLLPITLTMAAAAALLNIWLAIRCGMTRVKQKVMVGDGGNPVMLARMRAQANFVEYAPFFLILLGLVELGDGSAHWLWWAGIVFILARIVHALGMDRPAPNAFRAGGIFLTLLVIIVLAVAAIRLAYTAGQPVMLG
ncbi:MAG: MAPEG family protein [Sphingomonadaceae bacterium]